MSGNPDQPQRNNRRKRARLGNSPGAAPMPRLPASGLEIRKCGKCGGRMELFLVENVVLNSVLPSGQRKHFRCLSCNKHIKIRSAWRLFLGSLGLPFFPLVFCVVYPLDEIWKFVILALLAVYPLVIVSEIYVRLTNPPAAIENSR